MIVIPLTPAPSVTLPLESAAPAQAEAHEPTASPSQSSSKSRPNSFSREPQSPAVDVFQPALRRSTRRTKSTPHAVQLEEEVKPSPVAADPMTGIPLDRSEDDPKALKYDVPVDVPIPIFGKPSKDADRDLGRLYEAVSGARRIAVICGAGISVSSPANIPDFRSANGLFKKLKEQHPTAGLTSGKDLFDARLFNSETTSSLFYTMVAELKRLADEAQPTIFHRLLKRLDDEGRLQRVYTQNIDGLEGKVGLTFGLGETGDSTSTVRALGKRKRQGVNGLGGQSAWARSKSDSHLLVSKRQAVEVPDFGVPMFPRAIPLHGTLQSLTCALCSHKLTLSNTVHREDIVTNPELAVALDHKDSIEALELLREGEPVPCPKCANIDEARFAAGLRSRGVGRMKVDIVLYGGQNEGAERVGECLQRDILGLRDPFETPVPESTAEARARERKEKKEEQQRQEEKIKAEEEADAALAEEILNDTKGSICDTSRDRDDVLAAAFAEDEKLTNEGEPTVTFAALPEVPRSQKATRPPRLKPLPPDLLIVAGTSLKVPGTKRIVREFAKACHARDHRVYHSDSDEENENGEDSPNGKGKGNRRSRSRSKSAEAEDDAGDDSEDDLNAPIRTILFNYDFPNPSREWEDVFDVWVQGDLQRAALGIFPSRDIEDASDAGALAIEKTVTQHSWAPLMSALVEKRQASKKKGRKSGGASMSKSSSKDGDSTPSVRYSPEPGPLLARSKSESPIKKRRQLDLGCSQPKAGLTRTSSKTGTASIFGQSKGGEGKGKGGAQGKGASVVATKSKATRGSVAEVVISSVAPPTPPPSTQSADSTPEPETTNDVKSKGKRQAQLGNLGRGVKASTAKARGKAATSWSGTGPEVVIEQKRR